MRLLLRQYRCTFSRLKGIRRFSHEASAETPQYKNITTETSNSITTICINRLASRNSLTRETLSEMVSALQEFERDSAARAVVVAGEGGNLSSGFDLFELNECGYEAMRDAARPLLRRPLTDKPSVCAVTGFAVGEGLELALACDLRVIEDTAVMGFLGRRFGVPLSMDGGVRLTSLVGLSRAMDLIVTGRLIAGTVADDWGLAARMVATGTGIGQAINLAMSLVKFPQAAVLCDKLSAVNSTLDGSPDDRTRNEGAVLGLQGALRADLAEGVEKFHAGIGRHGKFAGLTLRPVKRWEHFEDEQLV